MDDIFERVQADSTIENWLAGEITGTVLEDWSTHLSPIAVQTTVTLQQRFGEQIRSLFATTEDRLASQASQLGSGTLDQLSEAETLGCFRRDKPPPVLARNPTETASRPQTLFRWVAVFHHRVTDLVTTIPLGENPRSP